MGFISLNCNSFVVFDHRGEVYIPELDLTFPLNPKTRIFGCQNPLSEGGDRKGLPKSFLNRFSKVYMTALTAQDYRLYDIRILLSLCSHMDLLGGQNFPDRKSLKEKKIFFWSSQMFFLQHMLKNGPIFTCDMSFGR